MIRFARPLESPCSHGRGIQLTVERSFLWWFCFVYIVLFQVCSRLKNLIDDSSSLWVSASFLGIWPSHKNLPLLQRSVIVLCNGIRLVLRVIRIFLHLAYESRAWIEINFTYDRDWRSNSCAVSTFFFYNCLFIGILQGSQSGKSRGTHQIRTGTFV